MAKRLPACCSSFWWHMRGHFAAATARRRSVARVTQAPVRRLLVVCHGNIYRSPLVAALLRRWLAGSIEIRSAGFHEARGRPPPPGHVAMSAKLGIDLASHRSEIVTPADIAWADLIVLMDRHNWHALRRMGADARKFVWLGAFGGAVEVEDPYGMPATAAWRVVQRLHRCAEAMASAITAHRVNTSQDIIGP